MSAIQVGELHIPLAQSAGPLDDPAGLGFDDLSRLGQQTRQGAVERPALSRLVVAGDCAGGSLRNVQCQVLAQLVARLELGARRLRPSISDTDGEERLRNEVNRPRIRGGCLV